MADSGRVVSTLRRAQRATPNQRYMAFLSYSHQDEAEADFLHRRLEEYRVPAALVGRLTDMGPVPARLSPVFRDRHELAAADDLGEEIVQAIAGSRFLIVLCSPASARSRWTNAEIACFKKMHGEKRVLAAIVGGEPFASEDPQATVEECFPEALRQKHDSRGRPTGRRADPIAADLRDSGDGREAGLLKIIAGMLGVGLDELVQRESRRRQRRTNLIAASSLGGMLIASILAVTAIQGREAARDERRAAEGLIGFMLGDLREKLEPIGRLDVLDSVGARALQYYASQDRRSVSDDSLAQQAKALTMIGEIAFSRGQLDDALARYRQSFATTRELLDRDPDNPQRLFNHAQNVFWVGYVDWRRGRRAEAVEAYREYRRLAERMIAAAPGNPDYQLERIYADTNLGTVLMEQRDFTAAGDRYLATLNDIEALVRRDPSPQFQDMRIEALAWLADARQSSGRLDEAMAYRRRELRQIAAMWAAAPDPRLRKQEIAARHGLARTLTMRGDTAAALAELERAVAAGEALARRDPSNAEWLRGLAATRLEQGDILLLAGRRTEAAAATEAGCALDRQLESRSSSARGSLPGVCLRNRIRLALASGQRSEALQLAQEGVAAARGAAAADDRPMLVSEAEALLGEALRANGQRQAARAADERALAAWPRSGQDRPRDMALKAALLSRLGRGQEARALARRLAGIGYAQPDYVSHHRQGG